jgi:hypothetical protein
MRTRARKSSSTDRAAANSASLGVSTAGRPCVRTAHSSRRWLTPPVRSTTGSTTSCSARRRLGPTPGATLPDDAAAEADAADYQRALAYITENLPQFKGYGTDLRQAYTANLNIDYTAAKVDLSRLRYPGDNERKCTPTEGPDVHPEPGFTHHQFCRLSDELQNEFGWLGSIDRLFDAYEKACLGAVARSRPISKASARRFAMPSNPATARRSGGPFSAFWAASFPPG